MQIQPAQTGLSVQVVDVTGGAASKARVTVLNEKTNAKVDGETDANGQLRLADLPPGNYEITVTVPGFNSLKQSHISVPARDTLKLKLDVAALMGEVVVVNAHEHETAFARLCKKLTDRSSDKASSK